MRILYLSLSYIPSRRASSVQVMKMCSALAGLGHDVVLIGKKSKGTTEAGITNSFGFYGVPESFSVDTYPRPHGRGGGLVFAAAVAGALVKRLRWAELVYCRDIVGALIATSLGMPVLFEAHGMPSSPRIESLWRRVFGARRFVGLVAISDALRRDIAAAGLYDRDIVVAHDAADPPEGVAKATDSRPAGSRARIGYVGNLYPGRGIELIIELAAAMQECQFDVVGGSESDLQRWKGQSVPDNIVFHGFHPPSRLSEFYEHFDAVLMPHSKSGVVGATGGQDISRWTSPMKMFEYMASGVPLIASDLPVLQEVLRHGHNAVIAQAGDVSDWCAKTQMVLDDREMAVRLADQAATDLRTKFTWDARARRVMDNVYGANSSH